MVASITTTMKTAKSAALRTACTAFLLQSATTATVVHLIAAPRTSATMPAAVVKQTPPRAIFNSAVVTPSGKLETQEFRASRRA